ncbi:MAG: phytase [Bacteroidetes bacterium]|nr:phytase [Bacteroidota bacterium]
MNRFLFLFLLVFVACQQAEQEAPETKEETRIQPTTVTDSLPHDSDDPAIWVNKKDYSKSLILGTDKDSLGAIFVFDLAGKIIRNKTVSPVARPNNIDVEYGLIRQEDTIDIAVFTERYTNKLRVLSVPQMQYVDGAGIPVFEGETEEEFDAPMGVALYKNPSTGIVYAIISRKAGPKDGTYLWQYELKVDSLDRVRGELVRKFGYYSGDAEIEAIAVDDEAGKVYYSDESTGIRVYYAHPDSSNSELLLFGQNDFTEDREGIALWKRKGATKVIVSDQQDHSFVVYDLQEKGEPKMSDRWLASTIETDGCEVYPDSLSPQYPKGVFVAMSEGRVFHFYDLRLFGY